jgi:hypothetical protein
MLTDILNLVYMEQFQRTFLDMQLDSHSKTSQDIFSDVHERIGGPKFYRKFFRIEKFCW